MNLQTESAIESAAALAKLDGNYQLGYLLDMALIHSRDRESAAAKKFWKVIESQAIATAKKYI